MIRAGFKQTFLVACSKMNQGFVWAINSTIQFDPIHLPVLLYLFLSKASQADEWGPIE